jgi:hypothetical protein
VWEVEYYSTCTVCFPAKENWMRKVKICLFGSAKWFWPCIFSHDAEAGRRHCKDLDLLLIGYIV